LDEALIAKPIGAYLRMALALEKSCRACASGLASRFISPSSTLRLEVGARSRKYATDLAVRRPIMHSHDGRVVPGSS